ncbi:hypothetical protein [Bacteroides gallinaceum]|uniref:Uncharacterized protein n=1 Tax=Bacteroides gallinaceum TaxID=1462571 RepID=A0ABT7VIC4_9BACE|nr:hypothetical protein [Bacteroides gallinaceum]MDM8325875.1 hypothetical protein [Bacteroides gallinaceum]
MKREVFDSAFNLRGVKERKRQESVSFRMALSTALRISSTDWHIKTMLGNDADGFSVLLYLFSYVLDSFSVVA